MEALPRSLCLHPSTKHPNLLPQHETFPPPFPIPLLLTMVVMIMVGSDWCLRIDVILLMLW